MIQVRAGDLVAVRTRRKYYYALVLDRIRLFGGNWAFVFHGTSERPLAAAQVLAGPHAGFHAFVDFIFAKREERLLRLARNVDPGPFSGPGYLKNAHEINTKARSWFISDMKFARVKRVQELSEAEKRYPLDERIDDVVMAKRVDMQWLPDKDERI